MTQIAAIAISLLKGDVLTIMNGFQKFSCSNLPRELSRSIEAKFNVTLSRDKVAFKSQYGQPGYYYRYRLNNTPQNAAGREAMNAYVKQHMGKSAEAKTDNEKKLLKQQELFLNI